MTGKSGACVLLRPRVEVERDLKKAAEQAQVLLARLDPGTPTALEEVTEERRGFRELTRTVLRQSFSADHELAGFNRAGNILGPSVSIMRPPPSVHDLVCDLRLGLRREHQFVVALQERLHLFPEEDQTPRKEQAESPPRVEQHFHGQAAVQFGSHNHQTIVVALQELVREIESGPGTSVEKAQAKGLLRKFVEHPLVTAVVGGAVGGLFKP